VRVFSINSGERCAARHAEVLEGPVDGRGMSDAFLANCSRCQQLVFDWQSHVMVVNVGRSGSSITRGACRRPERKPDLAEAKLRPL
jgi:hypothetical protein